MQLRLNNLRQLEQQTFDVLIVGGGINGAVSAASLAAKGARVALIDQGDFRWRVQFPLVKPRMGRDQVHGEFRVLAGEQTQQEPQYPGRGVPIHSARNQISDHYKQRLSLSRFFGVFRFTVVLGDWSFQDPPTEVHDPQAYKGIESRIDISRAAAGLEYFDRYLHDNDARFVFNFVRSAMNYGAIAANYVGLTQAERHNGQWAVTAKDEIDGRHVKDPAKAIVNVHRGPMPTNSTRWSSNPVSTSTFFQRACTSYCRQTGQQQAHIGVLRQRRALILCHSYGGKNLHRHNGHAGKHTPR